MIVWAHKFSKVNVFSWFFASSQYEHNGASQVKKNASQDGARGVEMVHEVPRHGGDLSLALGGVNSGSSGTI